MNLTINIPASLKGVPPAQVRSGLEKILAEYSAFDLELLLESAAVKKLPESRFVNL